MSKNKLTTTKNIVFITVIVLFVLILFILSNITYFPMEQQKTKATIKKLELAFANYNVKYNQYPEGTNKDIAKALMGENKDKNSFLNLNTPLSESGEFVDAWDMPIKIIFNENNIIFKSSGKNKIFDDEDDIQGDIASSEPFKYNGKTTR